MCGAPPALIIHRRPAVRAESEALNNSNRLFPRQVLQPGFDLARWGLAQSSDGMSDPFFTELI
jgi:hypothetical protein